MISVGFAGEQYARCPVIDISEYLSRWPDSVPQMIVQRPKEREVYFATISFDRGNATVVWEVNAYDTAVEGRGRAQLIFTKSETDRTVIGKSPVLTTYIQNSMPGTEEAEIPDPYETWVAALSRYAQNAASSAEQAQSYAEETKRAATAALEASEESDASARASAESERAARASATASVESAELASVHAEVAITGAETSVASAEEAGNQADQARQYAIVAAESAEAAQSNKTKSENARDAARDYSRTANAAAGIAVEAETNAEQAREAAAAAASQATSDAESAGRSAANAQEAETAAREASTGASDARDQAQRYSGTAEDAAQAAQGAENLARGYSESAEEAKGIAITAKNDAVAAKGAAEVAKRSAEEAKTLTESAKSDAVAAKENAESHTRQSEAWACGTINGEPVTEIEPQYHNNAQHYAGEASGSAAAAQAAAGHYPYIGNNGNWHVWDVSSGAYVDTGYHAQGPAGETQDVSGKADKVINAADGNFAALDVNGNLCDSGHKHADYLTQHQSLEGYVQETDYATDLVGGVVKILPANGIYLDANKQLAINYPTENQIKTGSAYFRPIVPALQHISVFYGIAKAAGDISQASSGNAVGSYTDTAKNAIQAMIGVEPGVMFVETVSETTPAITGEAGVRYVCGEVTEISIAPPAKGTIDVIFTSGTTPAVLTLPDTVRFPEWTDLTALDASTTYEIMITDALYGSVMTWAE